MVSGREGRGRHNSVANIPQYGVSATLAIRGIKWKALGYLLLFTVLAGPVRAQNIDGITGGVIALSSDGSEKTFTRSLVLAEATDEIWLRAINASDIFVRGREKVAMRVNGGAWIPFTPNNAAISCDPYYSVIADRQCFGPLNVYQFIVRADFRQGQNTVEFRLRPNYISQNAAIELAKFPKGGNQYVEVLEPMAGTPLRESRYAGGDPDRGKIIFEARNKWRESPQAGDRKQIAACADCHNPAEFNAWSFTDQQLYDRFGYHGANDQEAKDGIAYVRAHGKYFNDDGSVNTTTVTQSAPPYQPAPGFSQKGHIEWLLGAGYDAILHQTNDKGQWLWPSKEQMKAGAWPKGINYDEWINPTSPNDLQDSHPWAGLQSRWPQRHALDLVKGGESSPDWQTWYRDYEKAVEFAEAGNKAALYEQLQRVGGHNGTRLRNFEQGGHAGTPLPDGYGGSGFLYDWHQRMAVRTVSWMFIRFTHEYHTSKLWQEFADYKIRFAGHQLTGASRVVIYDDGSHIVESKKQTHPYFCGATAGFDWCSFEPYHSAQRLNVGVGGPQVNATNPYDAGYLLMFAGSGRNGYISARYVMDIARNQLNCPATDLSNAGSKPGWSCAGVRNGLYLWSHWEMIAGEYRFGGSEFGLTDEDRKRFMTFDIKYRLEKLARWKPSDYLRYPGCYLEDLQATGEVAKYAGHYPAANCNASLDKNGQAVNKPWQFQYAEAQLAYYMRDNLASAGVSCSVIDGIAAWGESLWPAANWEGTFQCSGNPDLGVEPAPTPNPQPDPDPTPDPQPADSTFDDTAVWTNIDEGDTRPTVTTIDDRYPEPVDGICFFLNGNTNRCDPTGPKEDSEFHFYVRKDVYQMQRTDEVLATWTDRQGRKWYTKTEIQCVGDDCDNSQPQPEPEPEPDNTIYVEVGADTLRYTIGADEYGFYSLFPDTVLTVRYDTVTVTVRDTVEVPVEVVVRDTVEVVVRDTVEVTVVDTVRVTPAVYELVVDGRVVVGYADENHAKAGILAVRETNPSAEVSIRVLYKVVE